MATLVAIGYPDQGTAEQARETVAKLESELVIQADQVAAISRDMEGKYHVHTTHGGASAGAGAAWGGFWGFLFGLLFFIPLPDWRSAPESVRCSATWARRNRQGLPTAGAGPPATRHLGAVHGDRAGDARQGDRGAAAVRRHRDQDLTLRGGHKEAPGSAAATGGRLAHPAHNSAQSYGPISKLSPFERHSQGRGIPGTRFHCRSGICSAHLQQCLDATRRCDFPCFARHPRPASQAPELASVGRNSSSVGARDGLPLRERSGHDHDVHAAVDRGRYRTEAVTSFGPSKGCATLIVARRSKRPARRLLVRLQADPPTR